MTTIEDIIAAHPYHPVFGCECTPEDAETGEKVVLDKSHERHLALLIAASFHPVLDQLAELSMTARRRRDYAAAETLDVVRNRLLAHLRAGGAA